MSTRRNIATWIHRLNLVWMKDLTNTLEWIIMKDNGLKVANSRDWSIDFLKNTFFHRRLKIKSFQEKEANKGITNLNRFNRSRYLTMRRLCSMHIKILQEWTQTRDIQIQGISKVRNSSSYKMWKLAKEEKVVEW